MNAQSFYNKMNTLTIQINVKEYNTIAITELWLQSGQGWGPNIHGYQIFRLDSRNGKKLGGIVRKAKNQKNSENEYCH